MATTTHQQIAQAALNLLAQGKSPKRVADSLAGYLVAERRTRELDSIARELETLRYQQDGILEAVVVSANKLDQSINKTIEQLMHAKRVHLHHRIDPEVVGGARVHALDKRLDLTIRRKLDQLKQVTKAV